MATTTDPSTLQLLAMLGLGDQAGTSQQDIENALYGRMEGDINRRSGLDAQAALENTFARGVGSGTISADAMTPIQRTRNDALLKARQDAFTGAQSARLAALGQAAAVSQQAISSGASAGAQQQALGLQKRGQDISKTAATENLVGQGVGGLGGAAASTAGLLYAPEIKSRLRALLGSGGDTTKMAGAVPAGPPTAAPDAGAAGLAGLAATGTSAAPASAPAFSPVSFEMPSSGGFGSGGGLGDLAQWNFQMPDASGWEDWLSNVPTKAFDWGDYL